MNDEQILSVISNFVSGEPVLSESLLGIYLFGSAARGSQKLSRISDLDLLVVSKKELENFDICNSLSRMVEKIQAETSEQKVAVAFLTVSEVSLMVSPQLAMSWTAVGKTIWGMPFIEFKQILNKEVSRLDVERSLVRRCKFRLYDIRGEMIRGPKTVEALSQRIRNAAKGVVWGIQTILFLDGMSVEDIDMDQLIAKGQEISELDQETSDVIRRIVISGEEISDQDIFAKLFGVLENIGDKTIRMMELHSKEHGNLKVLDPF